MKNSPEKEQWWNQSLLSFQEKLGYSFLRRELLEEALTHASYAYEEGLPYYNERLEFLGDAVLELVVSAELYGEYPDLDEGKLTQFRSNLVRKKALFIWGKSMELPRLIRVGKGIEHQGINSSIIADAVEAVFGAVFYDGGFQVAQKVIRRYLFFQSTVNPYEENQDPKSLLQVETQKRGMGHPDYVVASSEGPSHLPKFTVHLKIDGVIFGCGTGHSRKLAEIQAAAQGLSKISLLKREGIEGGEEKEIDHGSYAKSNYNDQR